VSFRGLRPFYKEELQKSTAVKTLPCLSKIFLHNFILKAMRSGEWGSSGRGKSRRRGRPLKIRRGESGPERILFSREKGIKRTSPSSSPASSHTSSPTRWGRRRRARRRRASLRGPSSARSECSKSTKGEEAIPMGPSLSSSAQPGWPSRRARRPRSAGPSKIIQFTSLK